MRETSFYGRARFQTISGPLTVNASLARVWRIQASVGGLTVTVADPLPRMRGGPGLWIFNTGSNGFALTTSLGTIGVPVGSVVILNAFSDPPVWFGIIRTIGAGGTAVVYRPFVIAGGGGLLAQTGVGYFEPTGAWSATAGIPTGKTDAAGLNMGGGRGFVIGFEPQTAGVSDRNDQIDISGVWINRATCPFQTSQAAGVGFPALEMGKLLSGKGVPNTAEYRLDAWTSKKVVPYTKARGSAQQVFSQAVIISGEPVPIVNLKHDPVADTYWAIAFQPGAKRHSMSTFVLGAKVYAVGGREDVGPTRFNLNEEYDALLDSWITKTAYATVWAGCGISACFRGYVAGGNDIADAPQNIASSYVHDAWTSITPLPAVRASIQNAGCVVG